MTASIPDTQAHPSPAGAEPADRGDLEMRAKLLGSLLLFTRWAYRMRTGRDFRLSDPEGRESHYVTICRALTDVFFGRRTRLIICIPPRYGKTELLIHFVAWTMAHYPDSQYLYVSSSKDLATRATYAIREIMQMPAYQKVFGLSLDRSTTARDHFFTTAGGSVEAIGSGGSITGKGAGIKGCSRFGGAAIVDDLIQAGDAESETIREGANNWHYQVLDSRLNNRGITPIIAIGQRLHEHDYCAYLQEQKMESWDIIKIPALDDDLRPLDQSMHTREQLLSYKQHKPYIFASQYQQDPVPAGGGIYRAEWIPHLDDVPSIIASFVTVDAAETAKTYNDPTVFSHWGLYNRKSIFGDGIHCLHLLGCSQIWVEPYQLEHELGSFLIAACQIHKPYAIAIEAKSTGVTLLSAIKQHPGIRKIEISRTSASGSKVSRFLEIQQHISEGRVTVTKGTSVAKIFTDHMASITANNSHLHDDIADTCYDAVKLALIDKTILLGVSITHKQTAITNTLATAMDNLNRLRMGAR